MGLDLRPLTPDEITKRETALDLAAYLAGFPRPLTMPDVQVLYDALLGEEECPTHLGTAAGFAFGEQIQASSDFEWVQVSDEYGEELCLAAPGKAIYCAPVSMIQGRLERKERTDLTALRDETIDTVRRRISEGKAADRE